MWSERIEAYLETHKEEMVEDIFRLCRINSERMTAGEGEPFGHGVALALQTAQDLAESYGFYTKNYDNYALAVDLNDKEPQLDILTHLDVVPAGEGWSQTEPFEPILKDGNIYARGAADNKGPAVAAMYALRAVKDLQIPLKKRCRLLFGTDEESGFADIAHYYSIEREAPMTFAPDLAFPVINVEKGPTGISFKALFPKSDRLPRLISLDCGVKGNVVSEKAYAVVEGVDWKQMDQIGKVATEETGVAFLLEAVGEKQVKISAIGRGTHAALCSDGNNPLTAILTYLDQLPLAPCPQTEAIRNLLTIIPHGDLTGEHLGIAMQDEISGPLSLAFTILHVDATGLTGYLDCRTPLCATEENFIHVAKQRMEELGFLWTDVKRKLPHHIPIETPFVQTLLQVYENCTGRKGTCEYRGGYTYVHGLSNGVAFGAAMPGTDNRMHGANEFVVLDELLVSAKIFAGVIVELCS